MADPLMQTVEMIGAHLTRANLLRAFKEWQEARQIGDKTGDYGLHVAPGSSPWERCRTENNTGLCCPCEEDGPTAKLCPPGGPTLLFYQATNIMKFQEEWCHFVDEDANLPFFKNKIYVQWSNSVHQLRPNEIRALKWTEDLRKGTPEQSGFLVVTSPESYTTMVVNKFRDTENQVPKVAWGLVMRDECHVHRAETNAFLRDKLYEINANALQWPIYIFLSGTPYEKGPIDIVMYLRAMNHKKIGTNIDWSNDPSRPELAKCTPEAIKSLQLELINANKHKDPQDRISAQRPVVERWQEVLKVLFIRRTTSSFWFNSRIVNLKKHHRMRIDTPMPNQWANRVNSLLKEFQVRIRRAHAQGEDLERLFDHYFLFPRKSAICAATPGLFHLLKQVEQGKNDIKLTLDEAIKQRWLTDGEEGRNVSPYRQNLDLLVRSTPKFEHLQKVIDELKKLDQHTQEGRRIEKLVVMSQHGSSAITIWEVSLFQCSKMDGIDTNWWVLLHSTFVPVKSPCSLSIQD